MSLSILGVDANLGEDTTEQFQEVNGAYEVLRGEQIKTSAAANDSTAESPFGGCGDNMYSHAASDSTAESPFGGFGGEKDLRDFFGGMGGGSDAHAQNHRHVVVGDDLSLDLNIDFKTAILGGKEKVHIRRSGTCGTCEGNGAKPGSKSSTCSTCGGNGVRDSHTPCPVCRGTGQKIEAYCGSCDGKGLNQITKEINVTIPAGMGDGSKLLVRGEGSAGPNGGPAGDLYIYLRVKEDPTFRREGAEIYSEKSISYLDAILGNSIKIPGVDGEERVKVPPGTESGHVIRLKGKGASRLENANQRGDHYVTMKVEIPKDIGEKEGLDLRILQKINDFRKEMSIDETKFDQRPDHKSREEELEWEVARLGTLVEKEQQKCKLQQSKQLLHHEATIKELQVRHKQELEDGTTRWKSVCKERDRVQKEVHALEKQLGQLERKSASEIRGLQQAKESLEEGHDRAQKERKALKTQLDQLQSQSAAEIRGLQQANASLQMERDRAQKERQALKMQLDQLQSQSTSKVRGLQQALASLEEGRDHVQNERQALKRQLDQVKSQSTSKIRGLQHAKASLEEERGRFQRRERQAFKSQPDQLESQPAAEIEALKQAKSSLQEELTTAIDRRPLQRNDLFPPRRSGWWES